MALATEDTRGVETGNLNPGDLYDLKLEDRSPPELRKAIFIGTNRSYALKHSQAENTSIFNHELKSLINQLLAVACHRFTEEIATQKLSAQ